MGTHSMIGLQNKDGSIDAIYCHWDGYIEHNGKILFEHYQDIEKIKTLISMGDMSGLGANISPIGEHSFECPEENVCIFYRRDRGEDNNSAITYNNLNEFEREQYNYIYSADLQVWMYAKSTGGWQMLEDEVKRVCK